MTGPKHIVTVSPGILNPARGGGGNWGSLVLRMLVEAEYRVTHVAVRGQHGDIPGFDEAAAAWKAEGVEVIVVPYRFKEQPLNMRRKIARVALADPFAIFNGHRTVAEDVRNAIDEIRPDCVICFAFFATLWTSLLAMPRAAIQAEGQHVNLQTQFEFFPRVKPSVSPSRLKYALRTLMTIHLTERATVKTNKKLDALYFQGNHYVQWARSHGLNNAHFVTTPVSDPVGRQWKTERLKRENSEGPCRILMIGHLHSTSNRSGLPIFFHEVLPELERLLGRDQFEVHIVGNNEQLPAEFDGFREHPSLKWRGPVYPPHEEFLRSNVLLVPIPARTGSRVRIINGFSYGCCVVAHTANVLGISELEHDKNVLLGDTGPLIAQEVARAARDSDLRLRLGAEGRSTFERCYSQSAARNQYLEIPKLLCSRDRNPITSKD